MALVRKNSSVDVYRERFHLTGRFRVAEFYNPENPGHYSRAMYGKQLSEFQEKFFIAPLERDAHQTIGALWSSHSGESEGRGFGKSMMMSEESKLVNRDCGAKILSGFDIKDEDVVANPFLAAYGTFEQSKGVQNFPAALLDGVAFTLSCEYGDGSNVHQELRRRILASLEADPDYASETIRQALLKKLTRYKFLGIQFSHRQIAAFIDALCGEDTEVLAEFLRERIGPRIRAALGFHFVHIFNAFASLAGIVHIVYFIDQIENFAKYTRHQDRDVRILRESMCQTSPTADMASFVFQMHMNALRVLEPLWNAEHLPSLDYSRPLNRERIVDLQGLRTLGEAKKAAAEIFSAKRPKGSKSPSPLHPFNEDTLDVIRQSVGGNPRRFLETIDTVLYRASKATKGAFDKTGLLDLTFVRSATEEASQRAQDVDETELDELENPLR
jgi:hypothetical protein